MKHKIVFVSLLVFLSQLVLAQTFLNTYPSQNGQVAHDMIETPEGDFVMIGERKLSNNTYDALIIKVNVNGDTIWTRTYGGNHDEYLNSITLMPDSTYLVAGKTFSFGIGTPYSSNWYLLNINKMGDTLWTWAYDLSCYDELFHAIPTSDGGFLISGYRFYSGMANKQGVVVKLTAARTLAWQYSIPMETINGSYGFEVFEEDNGTFLIGTYAGFYSMVRLSAGGNPVQSLPKVAGSFVLDFVPVKGGGFAVLMVSNSPGPWNTSIVRLDSNLNQLWVKGMNSVFSPISLNFSSLTKRMSIANIPGAFLLCRNNWNGFYDEIKLACVDTSGNILWARSHGTPNGGEGHHAISTRDGRITFCGFSNDTSYTRQLFFAIADSAGQITPVPAVAPLTPKGNVTICMGDSLQVSTAIGSYFNYTWYCNSVSIPGSGPSIKISSPGIYWVEINDGLNYSVSSEILNLSVSPLPQINLGSDTVLCYNSILMLDAGAGNISYQWSTADTMQMIYVVYGMKPFDTISVKVNNSAGCSATDTIIISWVPCIGLQEALKQEIMYTIYPNPAHDLLNIRLSHFNHNPTTLEIKTLCGKTVKQLVIPAGTTNVSFRIDDLTEGLYLWRTGEVNIKTGKLVKLD